MQRQQFDLSLTLRRASRLRQPLILRNINVVNHIIFLAQENRSLDHYFGALREYWAQNGYPDQSFDGLPQFNPLQARRCMGRPRPFRVAIPTTLRPTIASLIRITRLLRII